MNITHDMILDILENLSDDELRLFLEHLVDNNEHAKESLYKYYIGLLNQKFIEKKNYKERILNEIKIDKIHPYAFVSFYELINNSINKFNKDNDDFLYELLFEGYIQLSLKYPKLDFSDLLDYLNNVDTKLTSLTLEIIINKINLIKNNKLHLKIDLLTKILKYVNKNDISIFLGSFYTLYEFNDDKDIYLPLIDYLFIYFQKNFSKIKAIQFLEYFVIENYRINHTVVSYYIKDEDYEKALSIINKTNTSKLKDNEYKDYLLTKGNIYKELGSNTLYYKSLVDLILHNHFEYFKELKENQKERDFYSSLDFIVDNLKIKENSDLHMLHNVFKNNLCENGIINFYDYFNEDLIYEDILFFKELDIKKASSLYEYHILKLSSKIDNHYKLNYLSECVLDYKNNYAPLDFSSFLNKLKKNINKEYYNFLYENIIK